MNRLVEVSYAERQPLLQFYKNNREKIKIHKQDVCFGLLGADDKYLAAVRFCRLPDGCWLLRNMLVDVACRREGVGHELLRLLSSQMKAMATQSRDMVSTLYCFPWLELIPFYSAHEFTALDWESSLSEDGALEAFSNEVLSRYKAYRNRNLQIGVCAWGLKGANSVSKEAN